jgi:hypothetical protein
MVDEEARGFLRPIAQAATLSYLAASAVFLWSASGSLGDAIHTYHPVFSWSLAEITAARTVSLMDAGEAGLAVAYSQLSYFSAIFIFALMAAGIVAPFIGRARVLADPVVLMLMTVISVLMFAAFSNGPVFADMLWQARALPFNLANLPAFWFTTMVFGTLLVGWTLALLIHDILVSMVGSRRQDVQVPTFRRR